MISYSTPEELSNIESLRINGKFNEAIKELNILEKNEHLTPKDKLTFHLLKGLILFDMGKYDKSYELAKQSFKESQDLKENLYLIDAIFLKAINLYKQSYADKSLNLIDKFEPFLKKTSQVSKTELKMRESALASLKGNIYLSKGEPKIGKEYLMNALNGSKEIDNQPGISTLYGYLMAYYLDDEFDLNKAIEYNEKSLNIAKKISYNPLISTGLLRYGVIYEIKGELDLALKHYKQSLKFAKDMDQKTMLTASLNGLGSVYQEQGLFDQALKSFERCLEVKEKAGHRQGKFAILDSIFYLCFIKNDLDKAKYYFDQMRELKKQGLNLDQEQYFQLDEALLLIMSFKAEKQGQVKESLKRIIEKKIDFELTIRTLLCICNLLLIELRNTDNLDILDDIESYTIQIQDIAKKFDSYWLFVETCLLQAQLKLIIFEFNEAQNLLVKAMDIAQKYGQNRLIKLVINEQSELSKNNNKWERLQTSQAKISERMDLAHIEEQIGVLLQKRRYLKLIAS